MKLITLGTQAGPAIRGEETGIASAVVVGDSFYMVDFGLGCTRAAHTAGLRGRRFRAGLITHLHSDHIVELPGFLLWNWGQQVDGFIDPVRVLGPGPDREHPDGEALAGTRDMVDHFMKAFSYDLRIRRGDEGRPPFESLVDVREIRDADSGPFPVFDDDLVRVTGVLVDHPPVRPAYAFRIDSADGSITFSGDTAESPALAELAAGTDILVHEAVNLDYYESGDFHPAFVDHQRHSHTSPEGAGRVAAAAGARHLVLSHLAGVAPASTWRTRAATTFDGPVTVAGSGDVFELPAGASVGAVAG